MRAWGDAGRLVLAICAALLVALLSAASPAMAEVELGPGRGAGDVTGDLRYRASIDPDLAAALADWRAGAFGPDLAVASYSAAYAPETWFGVELVNAAPDDGRAGDPFAVTVDAPLAGGLRVFLVREGGPTDNLLDHSLFAPFDPAERAVLRLRTPVFTLAPGERALLLGHLQMGPFRDLRVGLHTPEELAEASLRWSALHTAFYAFAIACLVFFFGFQGAMGSRVGTFASGLFAAFLGLVALVDGLVFRLVHPERPELHSLIGFGLLFAISAAGFLMAGASLGAARGAPSRLSRALSGLALLPVAGFALSLAVPGPVTALLAYGLVALMLAAQLPGALAARADPVHPPVGAAALAGLSLAGAILVIVLAVTGWGGLVGGAEAMRGVFAFLLLATMTMLTANVVALRRRHLRAVEARVAALEAEAERAAELLAAERDYARARDLAELRQRRLAAASHDLKQPLMSLRLTFDAVASQMEPGVRARMREAFDYLGSLAAGYVDETVPEDAGSPEPYPLSVPLMTISHMFAEEAAARGADLRVTGSSAETAADPVALMRIASNLVSNAVKHGGGGRVVVGVRRMPLRLVVADEGGGMTAEELAALRAPYAKGEASEGHGLGLSVCFDLAEAGGMRLELASRKGRGTCAQLFLNAS